jgi:hypothetical protein
MNPWILVAVIGGVLCLVGAVVLAIGHARGEVDRRELVVTFVAYGAVIALAVIGAVRGWSGDEGLLLPFVVLFVEVWRRRHRASSRSDGPRSALKT